MTWDKTVDSGDLKIFIDGSEVSYDSQGSKTGDITDGGQDVKIGIAVDLTSDSLDGFVDEARISDIARDEDWIKTGFNNQNDPGDIGAAGFYTVGSEVASPLTAVELITFTGIAYDRAVLLEWRTGYEIDNLGFHLYREIDSERVQLTPALIAGSGLLAERGRAVTSVQAYAWWDHGATVATPDLVYWLQDVDFDGTSTWHGPMTPVAGGHLIDVGPPAPGEGVAGESSRALSRLAEVQGARRRTFLTHGQAPGVTRGATTHGAATPLETQWALAGQPAVKIGVRRTGWFRVTQAELVAGGLDPTVDPRRLQLFVNGVEQAMTVTGEADGQFDPADSIGFYGEGVDTAYTDLRVYWVVSGASQGRRIGAAIPLRPLATTNAAATTTAAAETDDPAPVAPPPPPAATAPARETVEARTPPADTPATPAPTAAAPAAATDAPAAVATPTPAAAAALARAATAAALAPARTAGETRQPAPAAPAGPAASRATPRAPLFVVAPPAWTSPVAPPRRPASSRGAERPAPPDADAPTPAAGDDETPPFMLAVAARAVAWQLELARAAGVPEATIEELLTDYDPDGSIDASLQIALRLRTARRETREADATPPHC